MARKRFHKVLLYPWICWFSVALLYLFQYGLLILPSVFSANFRSDFSIGSTGVGVLYSAFLYTYVLMQIPVGVFFDRFRSSRVLFLASMFVVIGCLVFSISNDIWVAIFARLLMGFGGSFAFVGALYLGRSWFPIAMFALIVGLTEAMCGFSEIALLPLMAVLKNIQTWRTVTLEFALVFILLGLFIFFIVRERHPERKKLKRATRSDFNLILKNSTMWLLSLYVGFMSSFQMVIANMWGVPLLTSEYQIPIWLATVEVSLIMVGFILGCYFIGWLARFFADQLLMLICSVSQFIFVLLFWYLKLNLVGVGFIVFFIGMTSSSVVLAFDVVKKMIPENSYGLASGFINMFFGGMGILISPIVGYVFQVTDYINSALVPVVVCSFVAALIGIILYRRKLKFLPSKAQGGV